MTPGRNGMAVAAAEQEPASAAQAYVERARRLGLTEDDTLAAVRDALRAAYGGAEQEAAYGAG
ncbi:hypothetical protein ACFYZ8_24580 [Streptomyces sp. NPDC001668]|uniref:hypothetical protein n=1 Tax=unclassified Streptomyces TaxID=2593676 RepID=UPI003686F6A2